MASSSLRLGTCQTCNTTAARYSCPACQFPSCSLACSTSHKVRLDCSGIAAPVWSLPLKASDMSWGPLMRDQSYIASVGRKSEDVGRQLVKDKLIPSLRANDGDERLDDRNDRENKMVYEARKEGVNLVLLPKGMTKRVKNASRWDPKTQRMEWVLDMIFQANPASTSLSTSSPAPGSAPTPPTTYTTGPQPSTSTLHAALSVAFAQRDKKGKNTKLAKEGQDWITLQKKWLESFRPVEVAPAPTSEPPSTVEVATDASSTAQVSPGMTTPVDGDEEGVTVPTTAKSKGKEDDLAPSLIEEDAADAGEDDQEEETDEELDESPFILLLSLFTRPSKTPDSPPEHDDGDAPTRTEPPTPAARASTKPAPRRVFVISPHLPSLQSALVGATILECPCFELWNREAFLRARLQGKIQVVDQPRSLEGVQRPDSGGQWERGRGRGRGRGGGRGGGGRGGRGRGGPSQRSFGNTRGRGRGGARDGHARREEGSPMSRGPDSGWGKRAAGAAGHEAGGPMPKKVRE